MLIEFIDGPVFIQFNLFRPLDSQETGNLILKFLISRLLARVSHLIERPSFAVPMLMPMLMPVLITLLFPTMLTVLEAAKSYRQSHVPNQARVPVYRASGFGLSSHLAIILTHQIGANCSLR